MEEKFELIKKEIKYIDDDLVKTYLSGVTDEELDDCLKTILETNPNTEFVTVQYSKQNRRIYFYTKDSITTSKWISRKAKQTKRISTIPEILEEIKRVFLIDETGTNSCVSIYDADYIISLKDVLDIIKEKETSYNKMKKYYEDKIEISYQNRFHDNGHCFTSGFDHETNKLKMAFSTYSFGDYKYVLLYRVDEDLKAEEVDGYINTEEILISAGKYILEAIDKYKEYNEFKQQHCYKIRTVNSKFKVDISSYGVRVESDSNNFTLNMKSYNDEPEYSCTSYNITSLLDGKENTFLEKIYVNIDECPEWMHGILYEKRKRNLEIKQEEQEKMIASEKKAQEKEEKRKMKIQKMRNIFVRNKKQIEEK